MSNKCITYQLINKDHLPQDLPKILEGSSAILKTDYSKRTHSGIVTDISDKLGLTFQLKYIPTISFKLRIYRISNWFNGLPDQEALARDLNSFFMPPKEKCLLNRANIAGSPVLYCSSDPITACEEFGLKYGDVFFISVWDFDGTGLTFSDYTYGQGDNYDTSKLYREVESKFDAEINEESQKCMDYIYKFFASLFALRQDTYVPRDRYLIPSALAHRDMYEDDCAAIIYPSVRDIYKGVNYALRPDIAERRTALVKVFACIFNRRIGAQNIRFDIRAMGGLDNKKIGWSLYDRDNDVESTQEILRMRFTPY